jgi:predicted TIM-barrel fold metal-dependent hydrolase
MEYLPIDADNHYYESEDAFTRHGDEDVKKFVRWLSEGKRRHIVFGNNISTSLPNATFNPIAKPGCFHQRLQELESGSGSRVLSTTDRTRYGELEPIPSYYRDRDSRLSVMDGQGVDKAILFPTLGVGVEGLMSDNPRMAYKVFTAFNTWLNEDWGFSYRDRIYAAPYIPVLEPDYAVAELERVLDQGARVIALRPGPANGRSPADPIWDPFWSRLNEAKILVAYHGYAGPDQYDIAMRFLWQRQRVTDPEYQATLLRALRDSRPVLDTFIALVLGNLFGRFPNVRVASIENGCAWVDFCLHILDHAGTLLERTIRAFGTTVDDRPSEIFKERIYVSPFPEEDVLGLIDSIGAKRVLFGSDWPHPEGNIHPLDYMTCLKGLDDDSIKLVMRDNAEVVLAGQW